MVSKASHLKMILVEQAHKHNFTISGLEQPQGEACLSKYWHVVWKLAPVKVSCA